MRPISSIKAAAFALIVTALPAALAAQEQTMTAGPNITVTGELAPDTSAMTPGPRIEGTIVARGPNRIRVLAADGSSQIIFVNENTRIKSSGGFFGGSRDKLGAEQLLNGLPVEVKTMQAGGVLLANQVTLKTKDLKTANMIRNGTAQGFAEQTAATAALRGRMGDIDNYNIKGTTNVYFDTGKAVLSGAAKAELCSAATAAEGTNGALMLVVGYTDSVGSDEYNQTLSEKRAASVINHLQQACRWKPYRVMTPTGMAESDPLASNDTEEGKAQNRRVSVNVLVSKSIDGLQSASLEN